jgi:hypothetical protein
MSIFRMGLGCAVCSSLPQFRARPCLTSHPWATKSLPHGHLQTHQSLPFNGSPRNTVIPVLLMVLPIIKASRESCRIGTFRYIESGLSDVFFDNLSHSLFCARGIQQQVICHPSPFRRASNSLASTAMERYSPLRTRHLPLS